jgi:uncharacterized membrane protein YhaH (DUF805 family)
MNGGLLIHVLRRAIKAPFKLSGRRNRTDYIVYQVLLMLVLVLFWLSNYVLDLVGVHDFIRLLMVFPALVVYAGALISVFIAGAQRCRDIGWPGWAVFLTLIPLAGYVVWVLMLILPGTPGQNRYGMPPGLESGHVLHP